MTRLYSVIILACLFFGSAVVSAQTPNVSVDPLTGSGSVGIPLFSVTSGQVSVPVTLVYSGRGIKPKDVEGSAGIGWNISAGGQISRSVRGLPDDAYQDNALNQRFGWMAATDTAATKISGFTILNNGSTCSNEGTDITYIFNNFPFRNDTEPDIFYASAPGLNCQFLWSRDSLKFKTIGYQDVIFSYTTDSHGVINSFTLTNDKGIRYLFATGQSSTQKTMAGSQVYFSNRFQQYRNGITYFDSWHLTSITDPYGNAVTFTYTAQPQTSGADSVALYLSGNTAYTLQYRILNTSVPERLTSIGVSNNYTSQNSVTFQWDSLRNSGETGQTVCAAVTGYGHRYQFTYSLVGYSSYMRAFLRNVTDLSQGGCNSPFNYYFSYIGETYSGGNYTTLLPDSSSTKRDYWGYYSTTASSTTLLPSLYAKPAGGAYPYVIDVGSAEGSDYSCHYVNSNRVADTGAFMGTLNRVSYATGGYTTIYYEANSYFDALASTTIHGNGLRVRQVVDSVSSGSTNNLTRNYTYGTGEPVSLPQFAFLMPYSGAGTACTDWASATAISAYDLSDEDHSIMYTTASVSQAGAGKTTYQYAVPATYWDSSATPICSGCSTAEWAPTFDLMGRNNCAFTYGMIANRLYAYPFIPNANYDFERGMPTKVTTYNDAGTEVSESNYTYSRSYAPLKITAFKYEKNPNGSLLTYGYNKYTVFYNTSELSATVISKVFDSQNLAVARADTLTYTYGSSAHKLATKMQINNSDNSTLATNFKYAKDYSAAAGVNANVTAIYNMHLQNINAPVETYKQVTRAGTTATTEASLALFRDTTIGSNILCLPSQQFKWVQPNGGTFTPMSISGQTLTKDAGYFGTANYDMYDNTGFPLTVDDNYKHIGTSIINHFANQTIAVFSNAAYNQVAYADFDSDLPNPPYAFTITGGLPNAAVGSHAGNAYGLKSTQTATTTSTLSASPLASNYIFSIWINAAASGTLTLTLTGISTHPTVSYSTGGWKYYEIKIPKSTLSSSYTVSFVSNNNISIDDILWYPDVAEASTATYQPTTHWKLDATNTNGISSYFFYDQWGRPTFVEDQDFNIVKKNTYVGLTDINGFDHVTMTKPTFPVKGTAAGFGIMGVDSCAGNGAKVTWHFGDGGTQTVSILASASHTYTTTGKMAVTAVISSPAFGNYTLGPDTISVATSITVTYENNTFSNGAIGTATFTSLSGGPNYSFTGSTLNNAHINGGKYLITLTIPGGTKYVTGSGPTGSGYGNIQLAADCWGGACSLFQSSNTYTYSVDLTTCTTLDISVNQPNNCN